MTICSRAVALLAIAIASVSLLGQEADKPVSNKGRKPPAGLASIEGEHLTIYWSEEKDFLCGLSKALDEYDQIRIDPPATDEPTPLIIGHIAVWSDGKKFYAFSAKTAKWDTLKLQENSRASLAFDNNLPVVTSGDKMFRFTAEAGKWAAHNAGATAQSDSALAAKSEAQESKPDPAAPGAPGLTPSPVSPATEPLAGELNPAAGLPYGAPSERYLAGRNVIISFSKAHDRAWGFGESLGKWATQEINPPAPDATGIVADDNIAVWQVGSKYYGYSGKTGRWDVLQLPAGHSPRVIVSNDLARILDGNDLYTFAASTGRWTSPQGKESAIETPPVDDAEKVQVYSLRNARAEDIGKLVWQLYSREGLSVVADPRTNSLIARGPEKLLSIVHALLTRLDEKLDTATSSGTSTGLPHAEVSGQVAERAKEYDAKEQQAAKLAQQLRDAKGLEPTEKSKLNGELRRAVVQSFAARQKFHEAEVAQLAARIRGIEQTISARQKIANQIIDRRVQDLLDPNLQWDQSSPLTQSSPLGPRADSAASTAADATKSSAPPPRITYGTWLPAEAEQIWNALGIKVRPFTPEEWSESKPRGALIVTEILRDAPDQSLRVNDIIERWQSQGGLGGMMRATLHIRRDMQTFPVTVEYPSPPRAAASRSSLVPPGKGAPPSTTSAVTPANRSSAPATPPSENLLPRVTVGNWFPAEAEQIWNALSIKVRPLTADDAPKPQYRGGLKIIEVPATGPASGLQVGDIIITLQTEGASKLGRRVSLRILRGEEIIPVTIEFPAGSQLGKIEDTMRRKASPNAQIVYGNWFLAEAEQVWKTLGIKVRPITPEEESASKPKGTMLITEILANSEDHGLRVGDIITALQNEGGYGGKQKATLNIRRGDENFPVTIEYSSAPPSATSAVPGRATATERPPNVPRLPSDSDLTSARAYRDKLRERWQTLETLYNGGKVRLEDNLQAAMELGAAELAAADAADQRRTAEEHVERVTRIKKIVQDKYSSGVEPVQNFFAAEAALIKAQAQLAAVIRDGDGTSPNTAANLPQIVLPTPTGGQSIILRTADEFEQRIRDAEKTVADVEREFALVTDSKRRASMIGNRIRAPLQRLAFIREEYTAQLRLLELELQDAESAVQSAGKERDDTKTLFDSGTIPVTKAREAQRAYDAARLRLEKARTLLDLYRKADPKSTPAEPPAAAEPKPGKAKPT